MLDRREASSGLALDQIVRAIEEAPRMSAMSNDIASIKRMMADGGVAAGGCTRSTRERKKTVKRCCYCANLSTAMVMITSACHLLGSFQGLLFKGCIHIGTVAMR